MSLLQQINDHIQEKNKLREMNKHKSLLYLIISNFWSIFFLALFIIFYAVHILDKTLYIKFNESFIIVDGTKQLLTFRPLYVIWLMFLLLSIFYFMYHQYLAPENINKRRLEQIFLLQFFSFFVFLLPLLLTTLQEIQFNEYASYYGLFTIVFAGIYGVYYAYAHYTVKKIWLVSWRQYEYSGIELVLKAILIISPFIFWISVNNLFMLSVHRARINVLFTLSFVLFLIPVIYCSNYYDAIISKEYNRRPLYFAISLLNVLIYSTMTICYISINQG